MNLAFKHTKLIIVYILIIILAYHLLAVTGIVIGLLLPILWIFWPNRIFCIFCFFQSIFNKKNPYCKVCGRTITKGQPQRMRSMFITSLIIILLSNLSIILLIIESKYIFNLDIVQLIQQKISPQAQLSIEQQFINEQNNTVVFDVMITTTQPINLVQADLRFDTNIFSVQDIQLDKSFATIITEKSYSDENGFLAIKAGLPNPGFMGKGLLARVVLKRKQAGAANIQFLSSSKVLANDGDGTNLLSQSNNTIIEIK
jgi:hypothetical protein